MEETAAQQLWRELLEGMDSFLQTWQSVSKQTLTIEQHTQIYHLFGVWHRRQDLPQDPGDYALRLGPLLCGDQAERRLFDGHWQGFWRHKRDKAHPGFSSELQKRLPKTARSDPQEKETWYQQVTQKLKQRYKIGAAFLLAFVLSVFAGLVWYSWPTPTPGTNSSATVTQPPNPGVPSTNGNTGPEISPKPYLKTIPLRQPPPKLQIGTLERQRIERATYTVMGAILGGLSSFMFLAWWARRVMFENPRAVQKAAEQIHYKVVTEDFDTELIPGFSHALARLRFAPSGLKKIHWPRTLKSTAKNAGYPSLCYSRRKRQADYLVISDSRHLRDQAAWMMRGLADTLQRAQIRVHYYDFDRHPEWVWSKGLRTRRPIALQDAVLRHPGSRLLIVVDHEVLFYRLSGEIQSWTKHLREHPDFRLALLSEPNAAQRERLEVGGYSFGVLSRQSDLARVLEIKRSDFESESIAVKGFDRAWLSDAAPDDIAAVTGWLEDAVGIDGRRLLSAMAMYPKLHGDLTFALYQCLSQADSESPLEPSTLLKIVTLPWCRQGWLPRWLRQTLLKAQSQEDYRQLCRFYQDLFDTKESVGGKILQLDVAKPASFWRPGWLRSLINRADYESSLRDQIFAKVLLAPRSRIGELILPRRVMQALPSAALSKWLPMLTLTAFAAIVFGLIYVAWAVYGSPWYSRQVLSNKKSAYGEWTVTVSYHPGAAILRDPLAHGLSALGFGIAWKEDAAITKNRIDAPALIASELERVSEYMSWGREFAVNSQVELPVIQLANPTRTGAIFRDVKPAQDDLPGAYPEQLSWREAGDQKTPAAESSRPKSEVKPILPVMKPIPAGFFMMGSPDTEEGRWKAEGPVHKVTLRSFEMAETELTFAEWDRCVQAGACRDVGDEGWGREQRPVINVSWNDAQAYIRWLNDSEGLEGQSRYRLPTEAEWEYAARAGTKTAYFWEKKSQCNYANGADRAMQASKRYPTEWSYAACDDKFVYTAPVGNFKPNAWGLYDMSGNVWEWVEDCWHGSFQGAPEDGSAWLGTNEECTRRSVRGGGWGYDPRDLRSAGRGWIPADGAYDDTGFRLARTL